MGFFEFFPFLIGALIPGTCMLAVIMLSMTRWRGSSLQLGLSLTTVAYGIAYAFLITRSSRFHPLLALYGLPMLVGGAAFSFGFDRGGPDEGVLRSHWGEYPTAHGITPTSVWRPLGEEGAPRTP